MSSVKWTLIITHSVTMKSRGYRPVKIRLNPLAPNNVAILKMCFITISNYVLVSTVIFFLIYRFPIIILNIAESFSELQL